MKIEKEKILREVEKAVEGKKEIIPSKEVSRGEKEEAIKIRFAYGEGDYKFFEPSEIKSIQDI